MDQPHFTAAEAEALDLRPRIHEWLNDLVVAGVEERAALAAIQLAIAERALLNFGTQHTVAWLRETADQMAQHGDAILAQMKG
ncbi:MAG: hypothetical protein V4444_04620 [Pseudomonadota bacterium]